MIKVTISISSCGAQHSRAHSHAQSLRFTTIQVLNGSEALISLIMVKNGSVSSASVQLTSSSSLQHQVRPQSVKSRSALDFKGACQDIRVNLSRPHVVQVKSVSDNVASALLEIIISLSLHHLSKIRVFSQRLIRLSSFHSLSGILGSPLLSLSSSRVILVF